SNPYSITRLVFDLNEPKYYALSSGTENLVISFFKGQSAPSFEGGQTAQTEVSPPATRTPFQSETTVPEGQKAQESPKTGPDKDIRPAPIVPKSPASPPPKSIEETAVLVKYASVNPPPVKTPEPQKTEVMKEEKATATEPEKTEVKAVEEPAQEDKFKPKTIHDAAEKYTGEILSMKFRDADLKDVILYLGERAGLNVIFDPDVKGAPVTCNLEDVPWDQALDLLLKNNKLGKTLVGNVLRIAPVKVLMEEEESQRMLRDTQEQAGPLVYKTVTLSYAKAKEVLDLIKSKKSPRGEILLDERTNTLIISDVKEKIDLLEKLISVIDTQTPQVSIEARIVEASSQFVRNLGVQWGFQGISDPFYGNQTAFKFPNKMLVDGAMIPQGITTKGLGGPLGGYAVNLPAPSYSMAVGLSFANVLDTFRLDMALTALESSGEGKIISCPKVTTQNNMEAEIIQGRQIPVQTTANFTVTTQYRNAALELRATPQITAEGTIIMTIEIQNNAADFEYLVQEIPVITTQSARTTVLVPDGGTTVIGGIYRVEDSVTRSRVPFLHKIPILGSLFRSLAVSKRNRELIIFITPRIIK
ncbi:MAG: type IV pilus secretin PilQ, partial [Candidatus Aminicenantales bacterium]